MTEQEKKLEQPVTMTSTPKLSDVWEDTLTNIFGYSNRTVDGKALRFWVRHQKFETLHHMKLYDLNSYQTNGLLETYKEDPNNLAELGLHHTLL